MTTPSKNPLNELSTDGINSKAPAQGLSESATASDTNTHSPEVDPPGRPANSHTHPSAGPSGVRCVEKLPSYIRSLMRINVPAVVTLAGKKSSLSSILEFEPGAIIQFDKSCDEMLDLEVGNHRIAVGEAVKMGDKFGLRVTSMVMPEERFYTAKKTEDQKPCSVFQRALSTCWGSHFEVNTDRRRYHVSQVFQPAVFHPLTPFTFHQVLQRQPQPILTFVQLSVRLGDNFLLLVFRLPAQDSAHSASQLCGSVDVDFAGSVDMKVDTCPVRRRQPEVPTAQQTRTVLD